MVVAARIPGRIGKQCRADPPLRSHLKKGGWTPEEDAVMAAAQARWGNAWTKIAELLPGRAENAVKNRWNSAFRRNNAHAFGRATDDRVARALQEARRGMEIIDRAGSLHADGGRHSPANMNAPPRRRAHRRARSPAQPPAPRRSTHLLNTGAPAEGLDGRAGHHRRAACRPSTTGPRRPYRNRRARSARSRSRRVAAAAADVPEAGHAGELPSDDRVPPGEEASVITPPPQAAKTAWPEESKAAVQKTLNPSPDNSVDGAGQPVSPV